MTEDAALVLDGESLTPEALERAATGGVRIALAPAGRARMAEARGLVEDAVATGTPIYGVTTGLGSRAGEALDGDALAEFSHRTVLGRAHAAGAPLPRAVVRAAMIVRLNTLLRGGAGASPALADHLLACLNAGLTPIVGETGSAGGGDLVLNATMGRALLGEGSLMDASGAVQDAAAALEAAGIPPPALGPRDGLALASHASFSAALASLGWTAAICAYEAAQTSAALALEGFRANLSPFDPEALAQRPQPGQAEAAAGIRDRLAESGLWSQGAARRLQDPMSMRNLPQIHGTARAALEYARSAVAAEINAASDNPVALIEGRRIVSTGAYHTPLLTSVCETVSRSFVHLTMAQSARIAKLLSARFTDLPMFLAAGDNQTNGLAPALKTAESATAEVSHAAQPAPIWPSVSADGVEDALTPAPTAARALARVAEQARVVTAVELLVAAQAVELRGARLAPRMQRVVATIRGISPRLETDRALTGEIDALAEAIGAGAFK